MNKKWEKKFSTFIMQTIAWFPMVLIILQLFRLGTYTIDWTNFNNPISTILENTLEYFNFNYDNEAKNLIVYGLGWSLFVELFEITYIVFIAFLNCIKSFFDRDGGKIC